MNNSGCAFAIEHSVPTRKFPPQRLKDARIPPSAMDHLRHVLPGYTEVSRHIPAQPPEVECPQQAPRATLVLDLVKHNLYGYITAGIDTVNEKMREPSQKSLPGWAARIEALRKRMGMKQIAFSRLVGVAQSAVSNWEQGNKEPGAETYVQLGKIAGDPDCWYFWERAGLTKSDLARVIPDLEQRLYIRGDLQINFIPARGAIKPGTLALKKKPDAVAVPLLRDAAAAGSPRLIEEAQVERTIIADARDCPHPEYTTCIRVRGRSMYPVLDDGYIVAVDTFVTEPERLIEHMVAARDPEGGITIKWLRKVGEDYMLLPQHTSPEYPPALISREPGWKIVGEVIWWIGKPK